MPSAFTATSSVVPLSDHWTLADGHPIFYRHASGPAGATSLPIIHLHGFAISGRYLVPTASRLATWYPTYVPDLPGYGHTPSTGHTLGIPGLAKTIVDFMDTLEIERAILLGNSLGCVTAVEVANLIPGRIARSILVSPSGGAHNEPLARGLGQLLRDGLREGPGLMRIAVPDYLRFGPVSAAELFRDMTRYDISTHLEALSLPMLLVTGSRDPLVSIPQLESTVQQRSNMMMVIQQGAAHAINFSHPQSLAQTVHTWLTDKPLPTANRTGHAFYLDDSLDRT